MITIMSFGYKNNVLMGGPPVADITIDLRRVIPNPHKIPEFNGMDGRSETLQRWVYDNGGKQILDRASELLMAFLVAADDVTIAFGCVGGKHRSMAMAEILQTELFRQGIDFTIIHLSLPMICQHCGRIKGQHQAKTLACPVGLKTRIGFTSFSNDTVFRQKVEI